jgi:thiol:disulfide interchange protein DsbD
MLDNLSNYLQNAPILAVLASYIGGVLTSFTPCVFPVIPITIGVLGVRQSVSKLQAFSLALLYVLGMAVVYAILGMLAGITGSFFGTVSVHPVTNFIVGNICLLFALSMFDALEIPLPQFLTNRRFVTGAKRGFWGVFFMGAVSGTIVAPCTAPVLGTLLTFIGSQQNYVYGGILMFAYALGLGTLLIIVGISSGFLATLQKKGVLMVVIKKILAFLMIIMAEYFFIRAGQFGF